MVKSFGLNIAIIGSSVMGKWHTYGYDKIIELYDDIPIEKIVMYTSNLTEKGNQRSAGRKWRQTGKRLLRVLILISSIFPHMTAFITRSQRNFSERKKGDMRESACE